MNLSRLIKLLGPTLALLIVLPSTSWSETPIACAPEPTDMPVGYGFLVSCDIGAAGDQDLFRLTAGAGEKIMISVADLSGSSTQDPCVELLDPLGVPTPNGARVCGESNVGINETISTNGVYTISITENDTTTMAYGLDIQRIAPTPSPNSTPICYGCNEAGSIDLGGDNDLFTFFGVPGAVIELTVSDASGSSTQDPCIQLFGPDGIETTNGTRICGESTATISETIVQGGVHRVKVAENDTTTMNYTLDLQCLVPPCPNITTPDVSGAIKLVDAPLQDVPVILRGSDASIQVKRTNASGQYSFETVPDGEFTVIIRGTK